MRSLKLIAITLLILLEACSEGEAQDLASLTHTGFKFKWMPGNYSQYLYFLNEETILLGSGKTDSGNLGAMYGRSREKCTHQKMVGAETDICGSFEINGNQIVMHDRITRKFIDGRSENESSEVVVMMSATSCSGNSTWSNISHAISSCARVQGASFLGG